jgi:hypothetical protein
MTMTNLQEVKRRKSKIEPGAEGKRSGILSSLLPFGGKKSGTDHDTDHGTAQDEVWDAGPNMEEIMPAAHTSPMRHADQDDMKVQEVEDLY